jgi:phosphoribosyl 1,2-cyclic phosphodiesterase
VIKKLSRYLSPPLFPVRIRDFKCQLKFHNYPRRPFLLGPFQITAKYICHPGPTVGFKIREDKHAMAYIPDHEPALASELFQGEPEWTSGMELAWKVDHLIHDAQFLPEEYPSCIGWGHSTIEHALHFAELAQVNALGLFHHDPTHNDETLEGMYNDYIVGKTDIKVEICKENTSLEFN